MSNVPEESSRFNGAGKLNPKSKSQKPMKLERDYGLRAARGERLTSKD